MTIPILMETVITIGIDLQLVIDLPKMIQVFMEVIMLLKII